MEAAAQASAEKGTLLEVVAHLIPNHLHHPHRLPRSAIHLFETLTAAETSWMGHAQEGSLEILQVDKPAAAFGATTDRSAARCG